MKAAPDSAPNRPVRAARAPPAPHLVRKPHAQQRLGRLVLVDAPKAAHAALRPAAAAHQRATGPPPRRVPRAGGPLVVRPSAPIQLAAVALLRSVCRVCLLAAGAALDPLPAAHPPAAGAAQPAAAAAVALARPPAIPARGTAAARRRSSGWHRRHAWLLNCNACEGATASCSAQPSTLASNASLRLATQPASRAANKSCNAHTAWARPA